MADLKLVYVNPVGQNSDGINEYEFLFSETPDTVWAEDWELQCPSVCGDIKPGEDMYTETKRVKTDIDFFCAQQNNCYSMQDCIDGCIALMWFYDNKDNAIVFKFGESLNSTIKKLTENGINNII